MKPVLPALVAALLLPACAEQSDPASASLRSSGGDCFRAQSVNSFTPRGDRAVDVRITRRRQYRLELAGYCPDVDWSQQVALQSRSGSSWICRGLDAEIIVPDRTTGPQRCLVTEVRSLSEAEIEAADD